MAKLDSNQTTAIHNRRDDTTSTPLSMKIPTAARGPKAFKKEWNIEPRTHSNLHDDLSSARTDTTELKVILGMPD